MHYNNSSCQNENEIKLQSQQEKIKKLENELSLVKHKMDYLKYKSRI